MEDWKEKYKAQIKYQQERIAKNVSIKIFLPQEQDIYDRLNVSGNKAGYIKALIRQDILNRQKKDEN